MGGANVRASWRAGYRGGHTLGWCGCEREGCGGARTVGVGLWECGQEGSRRAEAGGTAACSFSFSNFPRMAPSSLAESRGRVGPF